MDTAWNSVIRLGYNWGDWKQVTIWSKKKRKIRNNIEEYFDQKIKKKYYWERVTTKKKENGKKLYPHTKKRNIQEN